MAYTKYSLTPADNNAAPPNGAPEGMLPSAVNDTMRDMMSQIRDVGDGIRTGVYTLTAPVITGGSINGTTVGASTASTGSFTSLTDSGNLTFTGTGNRILGDFSNATQSSRLMFQSSTTNGNTSVTTIPNGTSTLAAFNAFNSSDPNNSSFGQLRATAATIDIICGTTGTGTLLPFVITTGNNERLRIDTSGNVGIGTSSPSARLHSVSAVGVNSGTFTDNTNYTFEIKSGGSQVAYIGGQTGSALALAANGAERMRIDSSGNVLVGVTANSGVDTGVQRLVVTGIAGGNGGTLGLISDSLGRNIVLTDSSKTQIAVYSISSASANIGTNTSIPLLFSTVATERMRIDSSGNLFVGRTTVYNNTSRLTSVTTVASNAAGVFATAVAGDVGQASMFIGKFDNNTTTSQIFVKFLANNANTAMGQINGNGAGQAAFGNWSDSRLKENIENLSPQLANITALRPVEFDYIKSQGGGHQVGFVAQEIQQVYPDAVGETSDGFLTVTGWSKTEARLVKAIQELKAELDSVKAELQTLKGN